MFYQPWLSVILGYHMTSPRFKLKEYLSILLSLYSYEALQHLKTFIYTNFRFESVLRFAIPRGRLDFQALELRDI